MEEYNKYIKQLQEERYKKKKRLAILTVIAFSILILIMVGLYSVSLPKAAKPQKPVPVKEFPVKEYYDYNNGGDYLC